MIITRTPMRIPIGGGGTDLPAFYKKYGSFFISAAIDYYIYIAVKRRPIEGIRLAYSQIEEVKKVKDIQHKIIKSCLQYLKTDITRGLEIVSVGDLPAGTGMGSSGSFTVGLLNALYHLQKKSVSSAKLAKEACHINMNLLHAPSGKQDEYIASFGGFTCFEVDRTGAVKAYPLKISTKTLQTLQKNLLMFYTGIHRDSEVVLSKQKKALVTGDKRTIESLKKIQQIGFNIKDALEKGNTKLFGRLLHEHWIAKRQQKSVSNAKLDMWYDVAIKNGAIGGKIMGAGGGGFFAFYCEQQKGKLRKALKKVGLEEVKYNFDKEGSKLFTSI